MVKERLFQKIKYSVSYMILLPLLMITIYGGCGDNNENVITNTCYLPNSSTPCFDPNTGGSTSTIIDQTVEDVIADQENMEGFQDYLLITIIEESLAFIMPGTDPGCPYEQSELVIKTANDWNRFRNSCFFSSFEFQDIDFQNQIIIASLQEFARRGTTIAAVQKFNDSLVVIIEDEILTIPTPAPAFPISIISVPRLDMPVDFIRVEIEIEPIEIM